jgi:TPR repeat protein
MFRSRLPAIVLAILCALFLTPLPASSGQGDALGNAAALYDAGNYEAAYKQYSKLAKKGDVFSQYRMSYMTLMGLGTRADVVESLAWAMVAAESPLDSLKKYRAAVAALVPSDQREKAENKTGTYLRRWSGDKNATEDAMASVYRGGCTGTRLAKNCYADEGSGGAWIPWGEDRSGDPAQKERIEQINQDIVGSAAQLRAIPAS